MKVKELIKKLNQIENQNLEVKVFNIEFGGYDVVSCVELYEGNFETFIELEVNQDQ